MSQFFVHFNVAFLCSSQSCILFLHTFSASYPLQIRPISLPAQLQSHRTKAHIQFTPFVSWTFAADTAQKRLFKRVRVLFDWRAQTSRLFVTLSTLSSGWSQLATTTRYSNTRTHTHTRWEKKTRFPSYARFNVHLVAQNSLWIIESFRHDANNYSVYYFITLSA